MNQGIINRRLQTKNWLIVGILTGIIILLGTASNGNVTVATSTDAPISKTETVREAAKPGVKEAKSSTLATEKEVRTYFSDIPQLAEVARCESRFRHTGADGNIFRGVVNDQDVGVMQINEYFHLEVATELGYNVYTLRGNMAYARYLYEKEGITPWASSRPCWKTKVANIQKAEMLKELALNK